MDPDVRYVLSPTLFSALLFVMVSLGVRPPKLIVACSPLRSNYDQFMQTVLSLP
jgi:hypothetical protein